MTHEEEALSFGDIIRKNKVYLKFLLKHKFWIIGVVLGLTLISILYTSLSTPMYTVEKESWFTHDWPCKKDVEEEDVRDWCEEMLASIKMRDSILSITASYGDSSVNKRNYKRRISVICSKNLRFLIKVQHTSIDTANRIAADVRDVINNELKQFSNAFINEQLKSIATAIKLKQSVVDSLVTDMNRFCKENNILPDISQSMGIVQSEVKQGAITQMYDSLLTKGADYCVKILTLDRFNSSLNSEKLSIINYRNFISQNMLIDVPHTVISEPNNTKIIVATAIGALAGIICLLLLICYIEQHK